MRARERQAPARETDEELSTVAVEDCVDVLRDEAARAGSSSNHEGATCVVGRIGLDVGEPSFAGVQIGVGVAVLAHAHGGDPAFVVLAGAATLAEAVVVSPG